MTPAKAGTPSSLKQTQGTVNTQPRPFAASRVRQRFGRSRPSADFAPSEKRALKPMETAVRIAARERHNIHQRGENEPDAAHPGLRVRPAHRLVATTIDARPRVCSGREDRCLGGTQQPARTIPRGECFGGAALMPETASRLHFEGVLLGRMAMRPLRPVAFEAPFRGRVAKALDAVPLHGGCGVGRAGQAAGRRTTIAVVFPHPSAFPSRAAGPPRSPARSALPAWA